LRIIFPFLRNAFSSYRADSGKNEPKCEEVKLPEEGKKWPQILQESPHFFSDRVDQ
jgi:hypothetical protein